MSIDSDIYRDWFMFIRKPPCDEFQTRTCYIFRELDSEKCTIGGQNEDSGKFHVRIRTPRHR